MSRKWLFTLTLLSVLCLLPLALTAQDAEETPEPPAGGEMEVETTEEPLDVDVEITMEPPAEMTMEPSAEMTQEPDMEGMVDTMPMPSGTEVSLENLTNDTDEWYGEVVSVEGVITQFMNINIIVLGEDVPIDDDQVLVINTSGEFFDPMLINGARVNITGLVRRSFEDNVDSLEEFEEQVEWEGDEMSVDNPMTSLYDGSLPDDFNGYTVIELQDMRGVTVIDDNLDNDEEE